MYPPSQHATELALPPNPARTLRSVSSPLCTSLRRAVHPQKVLPGRLIKPRSARLIRHFHRFVSYKTRPGRIIVPAEQSKSPLSFVLSTPARPLVNPFAVLLACTRGSREALELLCGCRRNGAIRHGATGKGWVRSWERRSKEGRDMYCTCSPSLPPARKA